MRDEPTEPTEPKPNSQPLVEALAEGIGWALIAFVAAFLIGFIATY